MQKAMFLIGASLVALAVVAPVNANHAACQGAVQNFIAAFVDDRGSDGVWIYAESGAQFGYQPGGPQFPTGTYSDPCDHGSNQDLMLF